MASHRKHTITLRSLSVRQWLRLAMIIVAVIALVLLGVASRNFYATTPSHRPAVTAFSATDPKDALLNQVSRGGARDAISAHTSYVNVIINGHHRTVLGSNFTTVKSVLDAGDITLEEHDVVKPSLDAKVSEATVITITRANTQLETSDEPIAYNTVKKETSALAKGQEKVQQEGANGVMETAKLVTRSGKDIVASHVFASYVKQAPKDKVVLVGTGSSSHAIAAGGAANIGTTVPAGEMQQWAHDWLLSNGYTEADFTATVFIISHESGWRVNAMNPSGAYGLPQALPGGKMASAGADWATNYQTQLKWFWSYCNGRYGSIQGAYNFWVSHRYY